MLATFDALQDLERAVGLGRALGGRVRVRGAHVLIIGAGGSARAVASALAGAGCCRITIANRTRARGERLAARLAEMGDAAIVAVPLQALARGDVLADADLVVNATSLGLSGARLAIRYAAAPRHCLFVDLVYGVRATPFLVGAARARRRALDGGHMLLHQGALAFERWTGQRAPRAAMAGALRAAGLALTEPDAAGSVRPPPPSDTMSSRLGEVLQKRGDLTADQLAKAVEQQREHGGALSSHLVRLGFLSEEKLLSYLEREYRLPVVDPVAMDIPREVARPGARRRSSLKHHLMPISLAGSTLTVAMSDPSNLVAINEVKFLTGYDVKVAVAAAARSSSSDRALLRAASADYDEVLAQIENERRRARAGRRRDRPQELERATEDAPVVRLVNAILTSAIEARAATSISSRTRRCSASASASTACSKRSCSRRSS